MARYPQPPGDEGSRTNLDKTGGRKYKVEKVDQGQVGIVNIYQIVRGDQPIRGAKFGPFDPDKPGTVKYAQDKPKGVSSSREGKNEKSERIRVERKLSGKHDNHVIAWRDSKQAKNPRLAWIDPTNPKYTGPYLIPTTDYSITARERYNQILSANPGLINKDFNESDQKRLMEVFKNRILKVDSNQIKFEEAILRWAMNYRIPYNTMKDIYIKWKKSYNEKRIAEEAKIKEESSPFPSARSDVEKLGGLGRALAPKGLKPSDYPMARKMKLGEIISQGFVEIKDKGEIDNRYNKNPGSVALAIVDGQVKAFRENPRIEIQRRKKHAKIITKRKSVKKVKKQSRSSAMKKTILKKIKCNCRRR